MQSCWRVADTTPSCTRNNFTEVAVRPWLERQWYRIGVWHLFLWPASLLFRIAAAVRRRAYTAGVLRTERLPVPVIVVGNITVGGAGKTPLVIWLAAFLQSRGFSPGVVSRGYGGVVRHPVEVCAGSDPLRVGDEPVLIARRTECPVWVGANRGQAARGLLRAHPHCTVLISDDGLQHDALARQMEIAVVDGVRRFGNGLLLPAGPLREFPGRLSAVDAVVCNGGLPTTGEIGMVLTGRVFRRVMAPKVTAGPECFLSGRIHAVAGIGDPERFFGALRVMGIRPETHPFPDHHPFCPQDLSGWDADAVLMTEKDAVKCAAFAQTSWWYLEVSADVDARLGTCVLEKLGA